MKWTRGRGSGECSASILGMAAGLRSRIFLIFRCCSPRSCNMAANWLWLIDSVVGGNQYKTTLAIAISCRHNLFLYGLSLLLKRKGRFYCYLTYDLPPLFHLRPSA